jgi:putative tryptophan/tyrosine transport system substrate-binding protein
MKTSCAPPPTAPSRPGRRAALRLLAGTAAAWGCCGPAAAAGAELRILVGSAAEGGGAIVAALKQRFPGAQVSEDVQLLTARGGPAVYLAVGPAALQAALRADVTGPLVSAFVSSEAYLRLTSAMPARRGQSTTAIFAEASPVSQMQLIRRLYRRKVLVGVLISPSTRHLRPLIERAAVAADLAVSFEQVEPGGNPVRALAALTSASVLLAVPDPELYNAQVARAVLESTYRRRQGVIGFSKAMVSAGTLGAAYATVDDVAAQLAGMVEALMAGQVVDPQYPLYWRVAINDSVARSLDVTIDASVRELGNFPA